jgi:hypothetical protein
MTMDLARASVPELEAMAGQAHLILECEAALATHGGVLGAALGGADAAPWQHYPAGDVFDPHTHAQFFYHAHGPGEREPREHGHFHAFLRARGMPPGTRPLVLPELAIAGAPSAPAHSAPSAPAGEDGEPWCHLVGIAMDAQHRPFRLFTTNRWVTGETWYRAEDVAAMLDRFSLGPVGNEPFLNQWVAALVAFYRPSIAALVAKRDEAVMGWRRRRRGKIHVFEDRRLEVTSAIDISLGADIRAIEEALARRRRRAS